MNVRYLGNGKAFVVQRTSSGRTTLQEGGGGLSMRSSVRNGLLLGHEQAGKMVLDQAAQLGLMDRL